MDFLTEERRCEGYLIKYTNFIMKYQRRWFVFDGCKLSYYYDKEHDNIRPRGEVFLSEMGLKKMPDLMFVITQNGRPIYILKADDCKEYEKWTNILENAILELESCNSIREANELGFENISLDNKSLSVHSRSIEWFITNSFTVKDCCTQMCNYAKELEADLAVVLEILRNNPDHKIISRVLEINKKLETFCDLNLKAQHQIDSLTTPTNLITENAADDRQIVKPKNLMSEEKDSNSDDADSFHSAIHLPNSDSENSPASNIPKGSGGKYIPSQNGEDGTSFEDEASNISFQNEATPFGKQNVDETKEESDDLENLDFKTSFLLDPSNLAIIHHTRSASNLTQPTKQVPFNHRKTIKERPNIKYSFVEHLKGLIGKDLSRFAIPICFNEPISMLQRATEGMEYVELLHKAASCDCSHLQMCYVLGFVLSSYSSTAYRTNKPFNPLLGETYELDYYDDFGFKCISEQVSHHPPICALHATAKEWVLWETIEVATNLVWNGVKVIPKGLSQIIFKRTGFRYKWKKVPSNVRNVFMGNLWLEHEGDLEIHNVSTGDVGVISFAKYSTMKRNNYKIVTGSVRDKNDIERYQLKGEWHLYLECSKVNSSSINGRNKTSNVIPGSRIHIWSANRLPPNASKTYNFSEFCCSLNEPIPRVAPTDSRMRPDQRLMEDGDFTTAEVVKKKLEEEQRKRRKIAIENAKKTNNNGRSITSIEEIYEPVWFKMEDKKNPQEPDLYKYKNEYWECKETQAWDICPKIFEYQ